MENQGSTVPTRSFGGKLDNFVDNRERHFYQRMLRAYLDGKEYFRFGFDKDSGKPVTYKVQQSGTKMTDKELDKLLAEGYNDPGKVFSGVRIGKSELRQIVHDRQVEKREAERKLATPEKKSLMQKLGLTA